LTLTSDRVILHTVMHHSSTSTYIPNFIEIEETFCGRISCSNSYMETSLEHRTMFGEMSVHKHIWETRLHNSSIIEQF